MRTDRSSPDERSVRPGPRCGSATRASPARRRTPASRPRLRPPSPARLAGPCGPVCPAGCPYARPSQALAAALPGDVVEIEPGTYEDCLTISKDDIVLRGTGEGVRLRPRGCTNAVVVNSAAGVLIEGLQISDFATPAFDGNGIGHTGT